jgi:hypothetical protein
VVRITVEVGRGAVRYRVAVQAESIRRALEIVEGMNPGREIKVTFPIDPEGFFVEESTAVAGNDEREKQSAA